MANILIIDDEKAVRSLLRVVLESEDHHVLEASNGRLGLKLYREGSFDLIITDLIMPEMDGLTLISELTRSYLSVKVIAITGTRELLGRAKLLGARQTLHKPFDVKELLSAVKYELAH
ncbi:MAG TPA: response regulator [Nitrospira sp.]